MEWEEVEMLGYIKNIEGQVEAIEMVQNAYNGYQDVRTPIKLYRDLLNPKKEILLLILQQLREKLNL